MGPRWSSSTSATRSGQVPDSGLHPFAIFVANCTGEITPKDAERLAWFVRVGGYLFGSCWALSETIEQVYKLQRPVEDFEKTLAALCATSMEVTPHIVVGLHYGQILGEANALDMVSRYDVNALVLVVIMPFYAKPGTFVTPQTSDVGRIFLEARERLADQQVLLGCARPPGMHKRVTDAYAIMAGLDGIAFPADGAVSVAHTIGRPFEQAHSCCSIKVGSDLKSRLQASFAA